MKQGFITDSFGTTRHYVDDFLHRDDGPAIVYSDGDIAWYYKGKYKGSAYSGYSQEQFEILKRFKAFL